MNNLRLLVSLVSLLCFAPLALSHPGHHGDGLADVFFHAITGFDYVVLLFAGGGLWLLFN